MRGLLAASVLAVLPCPLRLNERARPAMLIAVALCLGTRAGMAEEIRLGSARGRFVVTGELPSEQPAWAEGGWAYQLRNSPPAAGGPWRGGATQMLFADGAVYMLSPEIAPEMLKALATPEGGESIPADSY